MEGVTSLKSHPNLNYYLAAQYAGSRRETVVNLFQFGQQQELLSYQTGNSARISKIDFDPFGSRFGACDTRGNLMLWKFGSSSKSLLPFKDIKCHSSSCNDFCFLKSSTVLATVGSSSSGGSVAMWDTLLPPDKAKIKGLFWLF